MWYHYALINREYKWEIRMISFWNQVTNKNHDVDE